MEPSGEVPFPEHTPSDAAEGGAMAGHLNKRRRIRRRRFSPSPPRSSALKKAESAIQNKCRLSCTDLGGSKGRSSPDRPLLMSSSPGQQATPGPARFSRHRNMVAASSSNTKTAELQYSGAAGSSIPVLCASQQPIPSGTPDGAAGGETLPFNLISRFSSY